MDYGLFTMPSHPPERKLFDGHQWDLQQLRWADELGFSEAWIGEHHFNSLGVLSCPDLVLSYIAARTRRIRLAPAVTVLPLHHPLRSLPNVLLTPHLGFVTEQVFGRFAEGITAGLEAWLDGRPLPLPVTPVAPGV